MPLFVFKYITVHHTGEYMTRGSHGLVSHYMWGVEIGDIDKDEDVRRVALSLFTFDPANFTKPELVE